MKKLLTILVLIMLIISFFQITNMYALYKEEMENENNMLLGAWHIKVNDSEVTSGGQAATFTIASNQLEDVKSEHIQAGKIAPGGQAYFDIVIDPSETDVSVVYTINIDTKVASNTNPDIVLTDAIEIVSAENYFAQGADGKTNKTPNEVFNAKDGTYTSVMPVNMITQGYKNYVRVYFKWKNVETNNELDTTLGETENAKLTIPLKITLKQYTGEDISNAI